MFNNLRTLLPSTTVVALAFLASTAFAQGSIPSLGAGSCDIMIFTDYFCQPCERTDTRAEPLIMELLATGKVKITFVDVQFNPLAPLYSRYYLYALNAQGEAKNMLKVRRTLFEAAQAKHIQTEDALIAYLKHKDIAIKPLHEHSVYPLIHSAIINAKIKTTPSCIVRCAPIHEKKYVGEKETINGLRELKRKLETRKKYTAEKGRQL